jgi:hypothetical protein
MKGFEKKARWFSCIFAVFLFAARMYAVAEAATFFVAQTGSDGNSCFQAQSANSPRHSINAGLSCLQPGDTLRVGAGVYEESIFSINSSSIPSGTPSAYTRIVGDGKVFLAPTSLTPAWNAGIYLGGSSSYIEFDGIGADGKYQSPLVTPGCCGLALDGAYSGEIHHIRLLNGEFKDNKCGSMGFTNATDIEIIGNYLHDDQCYTYSHGIYVGPGTNRIVIANNTIEGFTDYGLQFYSTSGRTANDSVIHDNVFRRNGSAQFGGGAMSVGGSNNRVYNNMVEANVNGIRVQYSHPYNVQVYSNIVQSNAYNSIYVHESSAYSTVHDNVLYDNGLNVVEDHGWETTLYNNVSSLVAPSPAPAPTPPPAPAPENTPSPAPPPDPAVLTKPQGLTAQCSDGGNTVVLRWDAVPYAESYYFRVDYIANNTGDVWFADSRDYFIDAYHATSFGAPVIPGENYMWWIHPANSTAGVGPSASGSFTCPVQ